MIERRLNQTMTGAIGNKDGLSWDMSLRLLRKAFFPGFIKSGSIFL